MIRLMEIQHFVHEVDVQLALEVNGLQHRQVRLVPGQGDGGHVHKAFT